MTGNPPNIIPCQYLRLYGIYNVRTLSCHLYSLLQALRKFVIRLFLDHPTYRTLTLHSLSLLNSALPELRFLSTELLERIIYSLAPDSASSSLTHSTRLSGDHTGKKMPSLLSDVSVSAAHVSDVHEGGARSLKASVSSVLPSSPVAVSTSEEEGSDLLQMALAVLLKVKPLVSLSVSLSPSLTHSSPPSLPSPPSLSLSPSLPLFSPPPPRSLSPFLLCFTPHIFTHTHTHSTWPTQDQMLKSP